MSQIKPSREKKYNISYVQTTVSGKVTLIILCQQHEEMYAEE